MNSGDRPRHTTPGDKAMKNNITTTTYTIQADANLELWLNKATEQKEFTVNVVENDDDGTLCIFAE